MAIGDYPDLMGVTELPCSLLADEHLVAQQCRARCLVADLLGRTSHVDVDDLRPLIDVEAGGLGHLTRIGPGDLHNPRLRLALVIDAPPRLLAGPEQGVLVDDVALYFGEAATPAVEEEHGQFTANRKTNAFNKSDEEACNWVFLTAIKALQERARQQGGNAVINIYSYYYKNEFVSETEFECGAGTMVAGVTMIGDVVTLAE